MLFLYVPLPQEAQFKGSWFGQPWGAQRVLDGLTVRYFRLQFLWCDFQERETLLNYAAKLTSDRWDAGIDWVYDGNLTAAHSPPYSMSHFLFLLLHIAKKLCKFPPRLSGSRPPERSLCITGRGRHLLLPLFKTGLRSRFRLCHPGAVLELQCTWSSRTSPLRRPTRCTGLPIISGIITSYLSLFKLASFSEIPSSFSWKMFQFSSVCSCLHLQFAPAPNTSPLPQSGATGQAYRRSTLWLGFRFPLKWQLAADGLNYQQWGTEPIY